MKRKENVRVLIIACALAVWISGAPSADQRTDLVDCALCWDSGQSHSLVAWLPLVFFFSLTHFIVSLYGCVLVTASALLFSMLLGLFLTLSGPFLV